MIPPRPTPSVPRPAARPLRTALCLALAAAVAVLPACKRNRVEPKGTPVRTQAAAPSVRGADTGLELWWWVVADPWAKPQDPEARPAPPPEPPSSPARGRRARKPEPPPAPPPKPYAVRVGKIDLEIALAPYLDRPIPLTPEERDRWRAAGLRLVAVPVADLDKVQSQVALIGQVQRQWFGELSTWTDIIQGPTTTARTPITVDEGVVVLDPGRLRLLARCWTVPLTAESGEPLPAVRLEIVPHHDPTLTEQRRMMAAVGLADPEVAAGTLFRRLSIGLTTTEPDAYLIVPDTPAADWRAPKTEPTPEDALAPTGPTGPDPERVRTLGEQMLATMPTSTTPRARAVLVLIPRLPAGFELLGR